VLDKYAVVLYLVNEMKKSILKNEMDMERRRESNRLFFNFHMQSTFFLLSNNLAKLKKCLQ